MLKPAPTLTAEYRAGKREAEMDLSRGQLRYRIYGLGETRDTHELYAEHLRNDYGIELVRVAGCVVTEELELQTKGYDDTMLAVIETRFGKNLLGRVTIKPLMNGNEPIHPTSSVIAPASPIVGLEWWKRVFVNTLVRRRVL